jgi:hypothetical protein
MVKRIKERDFVDEIKKAACTIDDSGTLHRKIIRYQGDFVSSYAVYHT